MYRRKITDVLRSPWTTTTTKPMVRIALLQPLMTATRMERTTKFVLGLRTGELICLNQSNSLSKFTKQACLKILKVLLTEILNKHVCRWTKSKYAYLNQPAIESMEPPKRRTSAYVPNCFAYKPTPLYPTSLGVF